ncbi:Rrf2 family transcriptional regulator [Polynucleobacter sp. 15G-AUS-farblos]|uniref:RrF2 family transcriptional regulator n=1 Tax=Polynucleobacter sp. 15G-AUS-farblos TaxID=2689094 RepID=UPI001C0B2672|nr:Rrf2 family transcriptional regulator [Polynucleobacter sp. 15G-AUS-farblos]MBU3584272.1 Rrf2 family transcriptional regulator [Polynucleobacter sp. 15G-AUS-farblos]
MEITIAAKAALNALVDIARYSSNGHPVPVPELAKRQKLSISRIELLLSALRRAGIVRGTKGRHGGYLLNQDPQELLIKDIVLAMNHIKKRKIEVSDLAKELYQSLEVYMKTYLSNASLSPAIRDYIPRFSDATSAPERRPYTSIVEPKRKPLKGEAQKVVKAQFKKVEEVALGPNSIFNFASYLDNKSS